MSDKVVIRHLPTGVAGPDSLPGSLPGGGPAELPFDIVAGTLSTIGAGAGCGASAGRGSNALERVMAVVKGRNGVHSDGLRPCDVTGEGIVVGKPRPGIEALLPGHPRPTAALSSTALPPGCGKTVGPA